MAEVEIRVIGMDWTCWKCGTAMRCVLGPSSGGLQEYVYGDTAIELCRRIMSADGPSDIAAGLAPSANGTASHCMTCGSVQGNHYLHSHALEMSYCEGEEELYRVLAQGTADADEWAMIEDGMP